MEAVSGNSRYSLVVDVLIGAGLHACIPFTSLAGVLLDGAMRSELQLPIEAMVLSNSLIFAAWIPGALVGGQISDRFGRKPACLGFSALSVLTIVATALLPPGSEALLYAARATSGFAIGAFMAPAYALLLESRVSSAKGAASFAWSLGYVFAISAFALLHLGIRAATDGGLLSGVDLSPWRLEQLLLALFVSLCAAATREWIVESPRWLLASGDAPRSLASLETICSWNGIDLEQALRADRKLAGLAAAAEGAKAEGAGKKRAAAAAAKTAAAAAKTRRGPAAKMRSAAAKTRSSTAGCSSTVGRSSARRTRAAAPAPAPAEEASWGELFSPSGMLPQTLGLGALQLSWNIAYYALAFSAGAMSDQLLLNFVLLGCCDLPGAAIAARSCDRDGARATARKMLSASGSLLLALAALQANTAGFDALLGITDAHAGAATALALLGKTAASGAFTAIYVLTTQVYPTRLAAAGLGCGSMFGKLGAALGPPLSALLPLPLSLAIIGSFSLGAGVLSGAVKGELPAATE